jgi:hypothetical protein
MSEFQGCPGSQMMDFGQRKETFQGETVGKIESELRQWPVQLHLVSPMAPYYRGAIKSKSLIGGRRISMKLQSLKMAYGCLNCMTPAMRCAGNERFDYLIADWGFYNPLIIMGGHACNLRGSNLFPQGEIFSCRKDILRGFSLPKGSREKSVIRIKEKGNESLPAFNYKKYRFF